jgi:hypothetical protein
MVGHGIAGIGTPHLAINIRRFGQAALTVLESAIVEQPLMFLHLGSLG